MQIFVGSTAYSVDAGVSVDTLKAMVEDKEFVPAERMQLAVNGTILEFGTLEGNGISDDDELELSMFVPAGMRKKWRKKRMRRLRRKRRKMRQRAR
jgi:small subunit ribosomal protein S27Ae